MRRRVTILVVGMLILSLSAWLTLDLGHQPGVTPENFRRLHKGMTKEQVEAILGPSNAGFGLGGSYWQGRDCWVSVSFPGMFVPFGGKASDGTLSMNLNLTDEQKDKIARLHKEMEDKRKEINDKYNEAMIAKPRSELKELEAKKKTSGGQLTDEEIRLYRDLDAASDAFHKDRETILTDEQKKIEASTEKLRNDPRPQWWRDVQRDLGLGD